MSNPHGFQPTSDLPGEPPDAPDFQTTAPVPPRLRTFTFKRWSGSITTVEAETVTFTSGGGLVFTTSDTLILGVPKQDWWDVREAPKGGTQ